MIDRLPAPHLQVRCFSEVETLQSVLLGEPVVAALLRGGTNPFFYGFRSAPDPEALRSEWVAFVECLDANGVTTIVIPWEGEAQGAENWHYPRDLAQVFGEMCVMASPVTSERGEETRHLGVALEAFGISSSIASQSVEFGDVICAEGGLIVAGYGPRSSRDGLVDLRSVLSPDFDRLIAVDTSHLGKDIRFAHLDLCFNVVAGKRALVYEGLLRAPAVRLADDGVVEGEFAELLKREGISVVLIDDHLQNAGATNFLSLDPDRIIVGRDAADAGLRAILREHRIATVEVPGAEILKTGGGPRCMSMPLLRSP